VQSFVDDDAGYLTWLDEHPDAFVINTYRTPSPAYIRLHQARCRTINGSPARGSRWTNDYRKICGTRAELETWARNLGGNAQPSPLCL
jgi:hypothetical protein